LPISRLPFPIGLIIFVYNSKGYVTGDKRFYEGCQYVFQSVSNSPYKIDSNQGKCPIVHLSGTQINQPLTKTRQFACYNNVCYNNQFKTLLPDMKKIERNSEQVFLPEERSVFFKMDSTVKKARNLLDSLFERAGLDLTVDQWVLIERLSLNEKMSQRQLALSSAKDAGTTTRILDLLCSKGFTLRVPSPADRRSFDVVLTPRGRTIFKKARKEAIKVRTKGFASLSDSEYSSFCEMLDKIYGDLS
jgi:DNA-binding MarR family transcriptional regulator